MRPKIKPIEEQPPKTLLEKLDDARAFLKTKDGSDLSKLRQQIKTHIPLTNDDHIMLLAISVEREARKPKQ